MKIVKTSYDESEVTMLLKDLSDVMKPLPTEEREKLIQSGVHYSEMLPEEKEPTADYMNLYHESMDRNKLKVACGMIILAEKLYKIHGDKLVIISLARAGLPVGILLKRYLEYMYGCNISHYAISIIRGKGIDTNAMEFIYGKECEKGVEHFQFVDGWTGKGAISTQLEEAVNELKAYNENRWSNLSAELAVLADPANICELRGTCSDFLLPSSCLNSTVSGLTSRTILNKYIDIDNGDFHGAVYFNQFENIDLSNNFIDAIFVTMTKVTVEDIREFVCNEEYLESTSNKVGMDHVKEICTVYGINDITKVKPGIGETTRVLLRRVPWKVLINTSMDDPDIQPILELCKEKNVPYEKYSMGNYKVAGIIKDLSADA